MGRLKDPYTRISVIEQDNRTGGISYWQVGDNQSVADGRGISLAEYIHALYGLLRQGRCREVLMIGCGGGTLATMLTRVRARVTIVDIDPVSFEIARRYFHMPDSVICHVADGKAFLRGHIKRYDAIVLDAFANQIIPRHFLKKSFFDLVKSRLKPRRSLFLINIIVRDDDDRSPDRLCWRLRETWRGVRLLDADGWEDRNAILAAGTVRGLKPPRLMLRPDGGGRDIAKDLKELDFRAIRA